MINDEPVYKKVIPGQDKPETYTDTRRLERESWYGDTESQERLNKKYRKKARQRYFQRKKKNKDGTPSDWYKEQLKKASQWKKENLEKIALARKKRINKKKLEEIESNWKKRKNG